LGLNKKHERAYPEYHGIARPISENPFNMTKGLFWNFHITAEFLQGDILNGRVYQYPVFKPLTSAGSPF